MEPNGYQRFIVHGINMSEEINNKKYEIIWDESSCYGWCWIINGKQRGGEGSEENSDPEYDDELLDYVLAKIRHDVKAGYSSFRDLMECLQTEDYISSSGSCETCGHYGGKTIWKI